MLRAKEPRAKDYDEAEILIELTLLNQQPLMLNLICFEELFDGSVRSLR